MVKRALIAITLLLFLGCKESHKKNSAIHAADSKLITLFKASNNSYPRISVHRGGKGLRNYPENCLETIKYVSDSINAVFEIDVAQTKEGELVLLHDNSLERTTTGHGLVKDLTYTELMKFNLVDDYGNKTNFKIPLFSEVLQWSKKNDVILTIDVKRGVNLKDIVNSIKKVNAQDVSIIITYNVDEAKSVYQLAPELLLSVSARNNEELNRLIEAKIPTQNMLAFTGTRLSKKSLYDSLHAHNIVCMLGTLGNLDERAKARGDELYLEWLDLGVDMLATDRPFAVNKTITK